MFMMNILQTFVRYYPYTILSENAIIDTESVTKTGSGLPFARIACSENFLYLEVVRMENRTKGTYA